MSQYFSVGKLAATFGLKGELILKHSLGNSPALERLDVIFLENGPDRFMPYFLEEVRIKGADEAYLKVEGVDSKEQARLLAFREVWLQEADFSRLAAMKAPISLLGFRLISGDEDLGEIVEVIQQPMQVLCMVILQGKEVLIPLHSETLQHVDNDLKQVHVQLPDGLLDVYLNPQAPEAL
jgi:16S rRNA processing protein RimM